MKSPAETNLTEIGIIKMPGMEMIGKMVTPINPHDDWEDQRWDDDDDDEDVLAAISALMSQLIGRSIMPPTPKYTLCLLCLLPF